MRLEKALIHLKENNLKPDNEFMLGVLYEDDLFSIINLTYQYDCDTEGDTEGDWWVAHLTEGYLTSTSGDQAFYSGESIDELLFELFCELEDEGLFEKIKGINYKVYCLDEDVSDSVTEYALCALFPDLPNSLSSDKRIPSKDDIAKFKSKAKVKIDTLNKNQDPES